MNNLFKKTNLLSSLLLLVTSCKGSSILDGIKVSYYGKSVTETALVLQNGKFQNDNIDFVVSSEPIVSKMMNKNSSLKIEENLTQVYSNKYSTNGFPQAGLFIRSDLDVSLNFNFLSNIKYNLNDLTLNKSKHTILNIDSKIDKENQDRLLSFDTSLLAKIQDSNSLGFIEYNKISKEDLINDFKILDTEIDDNIFSNNYNKDIESYQSDDFSYNIYVPPGAPSLIFSNIIDNEKLNITTPINISSQFQSKQADILVIDTITGYNLSKKYNYSYKLLSMITYGNLFLIMTRKDKNYKLDSSSIIFSYGENMIPDIVFKKIYEK